MTPEQDKATRLTTYVSPPIKQKLTNYVQQKQDESISQFIENAVKDKMREVGILPPIHKNR